MFQRVLDTFEILDSAYASGKAVQDLFASKGFGDIVEVQQLNGPKGTTDFVRIIIKGSNGKLSGGTAPTLGVTGRLGGLGARPEMIGFVSDGDGALTAIAVALKLCDMQKKGDVLPGDVIVTTHVCPNAPTSPHFPTPFMGSPVEMGTINTLEVEMDVDAVLSVDTTKGNKIICKRGFAISEQAVTEGFANVVWPGRFEVLRREPLVIVDGAHNPNGVEELANCLNTFLPGKKVTFIMGVLADKDYVSMLNSILPMARRFVAVRPESERALSAADLKNEIETRLHIPAVDGGTVKEGIAKALEQADEGDVIVIFGSLYQVGEVHEAFEA